MLSSAMNLLTLHWPLIIAVVGGVLSLIGVISQMASRSKGWQKSSYFLIAVGGILAIVSATGTTIRQSAQEDESRKKSNELLSMSRLLQVRTDELLEQGKRVNKLTETVAKRNYEISQKSSRITELVQESLSWTTGGENFCYFQFPHPNLKSNTIDLMLMTYGKYPVYDVSIKITDNEALSAALYSEERKGMPPLESQIDIMKLISIGSTIINLRTILPKMVYPIRKLKLPDADKQSYQINISARNGDAVQLLSYRRVNGIWKGAMRTYKRDNTFKEDVEPGFPRNEKGEAIW